MSVGTVALVVSVALAVVLTRWVVERAHRRRLLDVTARIAALRSGAAAGASVASGPEEELSVLAAELERSERARKESDAVLRLVVEEAPSATVFLAEGGRILLANARARELFFEGRDLVGQNFLSMFDRAPEALKRALVAEGDELLTVDDSDGEPRTLHLAKRHLVLAGEPVVLVALHDLTREIGRREIEVWKQVIRVIAHEVNNSLAPMSTVASTGRVLAQGTKGEAMLGQVFDTVTERAEHLARFLEGYVRFAKLPKPKHEEVPLRALAARMAVLWPGLVVEGDLDGVGSFDRAQIEQLLMNLLKNAREAGSPDSAVTLALDARDPRLVRLVVRDRGHGMPPDVMKRALLPLFSTKPKGGGLGLALCREIAEAHGGTLRLQARDGGGLEVIVKLPKASGEGTSSSASLILSRGP